MSARNRLRRSERVEQTEVEARARPEPGPRPALLLLGVLLTVVLAYANHFENGFHFDDYHSVVHNTYLRSLSNIPRFFADATTLTTLPTNQAYRPMMATSYAIDYWIAGGLSPFFFHLSTFVWFLGLCWLLFELFSLILAQAAGAPQPMVAVAITAFYALHTANAETINYISARSDVLSTFWACLCLWLYARRSGASRPGWGLFLLPMVIGALVKPTVLVTPGLLLLFTVFFEQPSQERETLPQLVARSWPASRSVAPALVLSVLLFELQKVMTPKTFDPGHVSALGYRLTQPYVILHYVFNFILPIDLSADTDLAELESLAEPRALIGGLFLILLLVIAVRTSLSRRLHPIAFGLWWFLLGLLPTSWTPLGEVANDHRTFFPYIGLSLSLGWAVRLAIEALRSRFPDRLPGELVAGGVSLVLLAHAVGVQQRNQVWKDDETLWRDVATKSPRNGRGLMNYGLALMGQGRMEEAETYYKKALLYRPEYSYLHTNLAILYATLGRNDEAEKYFSNALQFTPADPEPHYYYAEFLNKRGHAAEAIVELRRCLELAPQHPLARKLAREIYLEQGKLDELKQLARSTLAIDPTDVEAQRDLTRTTRPRSKLELLAEKARVEPTPENHLELSLAYYNAAQYEKSIDAAEAALGLKKDYPEALNNICVAHDALGRYAEAAEACQKALRISGEYSLAKNNGQQAKEHAALAAEGAAAVRRDPSVDNYLLFTLKYYQRQMYIPCIELAREGLDKHPESAELLNTLGSAYNTTGRYAEAIAVLEKALQIQPGFELARNNLRFAKEH